MKKRERPPVKDSSYTGVLLLVMFLLVMGSGWPTPVLAHAGLVRASPSDLCTSLEIPQFPSGSTECATGLILSTPPDSIRLWFSEPVQTVRRSIIVTRPTGNRIETGPIQLNTTEISVSFAGRDEGTYVVSWQVLSGDTHPLRGQFAFSIGRASASPNVEINSIREVGAVSTLGLALQIIARWLHFCGYALGFGPLLFWLVMSEVQNVPAVRRQIWRLIGIGIILLLIAEPLALLGQTASLDAGQIFDLDVIGDVLGSNFGLVMAQRVGAAIFLWVLSGYAREAGLRSVILVGLVLGLGLAVVDGQASHATNSGPLWLGLLINALHTAAMGSWIGGLAALLLVVQVKDLGKEREVLVSRFGRIAAGSVAVLVVTGTAMAVLHLNRPSDLFNQNYGLALSLKMVLVFITLALAWQGRRAKLELYQKRWWTLEALGLLTVLVLAGLLVSLPPPS